ncbi:MAG: trigger factor [Pseudonocardiales bacterium]|nr:trigger factor [Pseudonocardiales bacterium]MDT4974653.1 trigger factor [Pseudonocardiales bacterium]MDT4980263.1 trigger factor [Pseudonocardiales bacterium]
MKSTVETLSPTRVRLAVEVPFEELKPSLDAAYKKIGAQVKVPGFRPGKVPARVIDQRVGRATVLEEAINDALPRVYSKAARDAEIRPLGQPEIDVTNLDDGQSLSFTAEVDIRPEINLPELDGLAVTVPDVAVSDDEVDEQLSGLRDRFGTLKGVERPVQSGDYVSLDLLAMAGGVEVEGGSATGLSYEVGTGDLIDGLDDALVGKSVGDSATFTSTLQQGDQAGAEAEITATVNSVKEKELPAIDDEFAQLASEFDTVDELKDDLRTKLGRVKAFEQGSQARDNVLEKLMETVEFPLPESAVKAEIDFREHEIVHSLGHDDAMLDRYLGTQGKTRDEFNAELREGAEKSVRGQLLLDAIADKNDVQIGDAELTEYLIREAARYEMPPQEFANQIVQAGNLPDLIAGVRRSKALAGVLESAVITDESGNTVDLSALAPAARAELQDAGDQGSPMSGISDDVDEDVDNEAGERE